MGRLRSVTALEVAYAGSMTSAMEGRIKRAASTELGLQLEGRAQGASGLAQLIVAGSIRPDVFISVTPGPMEIVLKAGKAVRAEPVARTEMVIAYSRRSKFAEKFGAAAGQPQPSGAGLKSSEPWWRVLEVPGVRFGRTDPVTDPQGRNIIFVMQLAAHFYRQPDLARRILGPDMNPEQIFTEPSIPARLESGELDAASAYKIQPAAFGLPWIALPDEINLGSSRHMAEYRQALLNLNGKTFRPEPLIYYAAILKGAAHSAEGRRFVEWLAGSSGQQILRRAGYDGAGGAGPLTA